jgi:ABC-type nitrate/sulfonate/bicarbonate transport system ATPase subunit
MTVYENVLVGATFGRSGGGAGDGDAHRAGLEALAMAGLTGQANRLAGSLTLLERKRLELARALATGPRVLAAVVVLALGPLWALDSVLRTLISFLTLLVLAQMWSLLAGYAGLVSIGQRA